jgi:hypothetical protein
LLVLRDEINIAYPGRSKASDGTIGDAAHQAQGSASDHNPWLHLYGDTSTGVVTALDITHDPAHGVDIDVLTDRLAATRDPRIKYVIANGLILSGSAGPSPWVWRAYGGSDRHTSHFHLSVVADARCDDNRRWGITSAAPTPPQIPVTTLDDKTAGADRTERTYARIIGDLHDELILGGDFGRPNSAVNRVKRVENKIDVLQAPGVPTEEQVNAGILNAVLDPRVLKGIRDAVASHLQVARYSRFPP